MNSIETAIRYERYILLGSSQSSVEETGEVQVEGNPIRIPVPSVRPGSSAENIHKTHEGPHKHPQEAGDTSDNISRRHPIHGNIQGKVTDGQRHSFILVSPPGFNYKPKEVCTSPNAEARVLRDSSGQLEDDILTVTREGSKTEEAMSNNSGVTYGFHKKTMFSDWKTKVDIPGGHPSSSSAEVPSTGVYSSSTREISLRNARPYPQRGAYGTEVVDPESGYTKRKSPALTSSRNDHLLRCSKDGGLGSSVAFRIDRGDVDKGRSQPEHKHSGTAGSRAGNKNLHKGGEAKIHPHKDRQHHSVIIPNKNGGDKVPTNGNNHKKDLGVPSKTRDHDHGRMDPIPSEHDSRLGIQEREGLSRMEAMPSSFPGNLPKVGSSRDRPVCVQSIASIKTVLQLESRSRLSGGRCLPPRLGQVLPIRLPPVLPHHESSGASGKAGSTQDDSNHPSMAITTLVSTGNGQGSGSTNATASSPKAPIKPAERNASFIGKLLAKTSGLASVGDKLSKEGFSERTRNLIFNARREGTTEN